ncbi:bacteriocin [Aliiglaciecola sp. 3_MG-2023]|uniref:bacteriocin n=1 Tax=Aliiglaciecola sp. 3_MG-2023 TaxID=3062644 RepID=UPI0026E39C98|nr:bacteriocin [Aliiglaciecola sp. 3_MG-2023]MDO6692130.1 bacteriocin [Aliiglaciecola sp. 3_MG-2023]
MIELNNKELIEISGGMPDNEVAGYAIGYGVGYVFSGKAGYQLGISIYEFFH